MISIKMEYCYKIFKNNTLYDTSNWFTNLYSCEFAIYHYLLQNPLESNDMIYLVTNEPKEDDIGFQKLKTVEGGIYKNSNNCYKLFTHNFENTMIFFEDELVYLSALWIFNNKHLFKLLDNSSSFSKKPFINTPFEYKTLLYLGIDPNDIPWEHIIYHSDLKSWIYKNTSFDRDWLDDYFIHMIDLDKLAKDVQMLECKYTNVMNYFNIWDIFKE